VAAVDVETPVRRSADVSDDLAAALTEAVHGEVRFDAGSRATYSTDASNYRFPPIGVVLPRTVEDGVRAVEVCHRHEVPIVSRGGGTSLAGQTTNRAVVLDWSKYCNRLLEVDEDDRTCLVEPGIVLDDLNALLADRGLMWGPRPSPHQACTVGGMIGNNSCGATAQAYGKVVDNVVELEVLTYDGTRMWVGPTDDETYARIVRDGGRRAEIYQGLREIRDRHLAELRTRYPDIPRRVSGYNLDSLLPEKGFDLARALVGSEGTLVAVLRARLRLVPVPAARTLLVLGYRDVLAAARAVPSVLEHGPHRLEGLDDTLIGLERSMHLNPDAVRELPEGSGWLMVEMTGGTREEAERRAKALEKALTENDDAPVVSYYDDPDKEEQLWALRESGLGATARPPARHVTWEGWEDAAVAPDRLADYLADFQQLLAEYGYAETAALYGHFGQGCVHTRIPFEMRTADGVAAFRSFVQRSADLVSSFGGSLSGEHGDGQARAELLPRMYGRDVVQAFRETKALLDPDNGMNPGKVVDPQPLDSHLRLGTEFNPWSPRTHFGYPDDEHSFAKAVSRCVGVGRCRNHDGQPGEVMCPSYQVTHEEEHSTRGRSRLLFEMIRGEVITDGWRSTEVRDALDLCLACKGCKTDCPVDVDMATYKAEFLSHHYRGRLRPASHYSMGWLPVAARLAANAPGAVNRVLGNPLTARLVKKLGGVAPERDLPRFAQQRFTEWFRERPPRPGPAERGPVLLWPDTFDNNFHPSVARAAVEVLEDAGFEVRIPDKTLCCGLTWISTGQLATAKRVLHRTVAALREEIRAGVPVVGLEPSCTAVFRADAPELFPDDQDVRRLSHQTRTLSELLLERAPDWRTPPVGRRAMVQKHCHQHAVLGFDPDQELMDRCGVETQVLDSGCCGLAGNFGFERGHYDVSMACAERVLLPSVRDADPRTVVLADGFSCRTQVEQGDAGRTPVHLAELLASALRGRQLGDRPERMIRETNEEDR
jgi:FAD/FMN-containing dehydrogenase/Fe-S oxidoreductase